MTNPPTIFAVVAPIFFMVVFLLIIHSQVEESIQRNEERNKARARLINQERPELKEFYKTITRDGKVSYEELNNYEYLAALSLGEE